MQCLREDQLEILGVVLSLLRWTMLLREESACQLCSLLWLYYTTIARVNKETEQNVFYCCNGLKDIAVTTCRPASADDGYVVVDSILSDLLYYLWRVGLVALVRCAEKRVLCEWVTTLWVPHEDALCVANYRQIRALQPLSFAALELLIVSPCLRSAPSLIWKEIDP